MKKIPETDLIIEYLFATRAEELDDGKHVLCVRVVRGRRDC